MSATDIAVIGMDGRFPGARGIDEFWIMLRDGVEGITFFTEQELLEEGVPPEVVNGSRYVPAKGILPDSDLFDAAFFGYSPREASIIDPQQRLFLECAWHALEHAGIAPADTKAAIGVYGGSSAGSYLPLSPRDLARRNDAHDIVLGNDKDQLTTRTSYKLDLRGPSVCVQTACSSSLVAVHTAVQALLAGDCDVALAGGVSIAFPKVEGYTFHDEGIYSHDGHCRAFDAGANGTVHGDGVGLVVLKLLTAALEDGDNVHAVIKGTAVNNDGAAKVGYTAPSVSGQAAVIRAAQQVADVTPETISYVEAHGTGTALGDPVEVAGLTRAFRAGTDRTGFCALGSVKSNIGHLDVAAGIAGLIKTVLALKNELIPASLHFQSPNPAMKINDSPFFVNAEARPWPSGDVPRRAGVSSFGLGGTNAHVILEEAPPALTAERPAEALHEVLLLSAKTPAALAEMTADLTARLRATPEVDLADVACTTQVGRTALEYRRFAVCQDVVEAVSGLATAPVRRRPAIAPPVVFMFPGQGAQYAGMGAELYDSEPRFREEIDRCSEYVDLRGKLFAPGGDLDETAVAQPALFIVEYSLARLWQSWGVEPRAYLGHSIGEYVAACLAGVFTLPDALTLVTARGRFMQQAPRGAMLSVQLSEEELGTLTPGLSVAAVNAPGLCVVSGPEPAIDELAVRLAERQVACRRLRTSHAFHSAMMEPAARQLRDLVGRMTVRPPVTPFVSNVTGEWITDEQATDPGYWAEHTLSPVRFADGLATVLRDGAHTLLEAGPGQALSTLARMAAVDGTAVVPSMRHPLSPASDAAVLQEAAGLLWAAGASIDWRRRNAHRRRRRVPLPPYPFQHQRYWLDDVRVTGTEPRAAIATVSHHEVETEPGADPFVGSGPSDDTQRAVAAIWSDLLGVPTISPGDNFFDLGGHSLLGTRLTTRLREAFSVEVRLRDLFDAPTMGAQAELVNVLREAGQCRVAGTDGYEEGEL
ncbi:type I polyketide synthase [Streptosporangium sp. CA-135522]|uniref:type I polyketide synthase n=1 Tax=Streptosporangium sp. CA-135522 TaxID=3240072 RepID=UPI003D8E67E7